MCKTVTRDRSLCNPEQGLKLSPLSIGITMTLVTRFFSMEQPIVSHPQITITIMSGVDDGTTYEFNPNEAGMIQGQRWQLRIGRRDDNDIVLQHDTYVSRYHAELQHISDQWWIEDNTSTNGTFLESSVDYFNDDRVHGKVRIETGQLIRVGRTWLKIQA